MKKDKLAKAIITGTSDTKQKASKPGTPGKLVTRGTQAKQEPEEPR